MNPPTSSSAAAMREATASRTSTGDRLPVRNSSRSSSTVSAGRWVTGWRASKPLEVCSSGSISGTCLRRGYVGIEVSGIRPIWWWRAVVVTVVIVYFELPYSVSGWIPVWLPFLLAVVTEAQFFLSGWRSTPRRERVDPGPQVSDLEELGRGSLLSVPLRQGGELWLESGEFTEPEVAEWLRRNEEELAALPAGRFAAGPLRLDSDNAIRAVTEAPAPPAVAPRRSRLGVLVSVLIVVGVGVLLFSRSSGWQQLSRQTRAAARGTVFTAGGGDRRSSCHCQLRQPACRLRARG